MESSTVALIKQSWDIAKKRNPDLAVTFYNRLFEIAPSLKPLFKSNTQSQATKLQAMLDFLTQNLAHFPDLGDKIGELGNVHSKFYGVKKEHYQIVGEALIWTLQNASGDAWSVEVESAWLEVYQLLQSSMIGE